MSDVSDGISGSWAVLDRAEWQTGDELLVRLTDALAELGPDEGTRLYDYVAVDAVLGALEPESESRGVSEIRFEYDRYEIKITGAGVIAASPEPDSSAQPSA